MDVADVMDAAAAGAAALTFAVNAVHAAVAGASALTVPAVSNDIANK